MKTDHWIWIYLGMGGGFTRWAFLLFYGLFQGLAFGVGLLFVVLIAAMIAYR